MSTATIIDGKKFSATLRGRIAEEVTRLKNDHGLIPGLAVVLVGEDPASQVYVRNKNKSTIAAGMNSFEYLMDDNVSEADLIAKVKELNTDPAVHGILVQLPLPKHINEAAVIETITPEKKVYILINKPKDFVFESEDKKQLTLSYLIRNFSEKLNMGYQPKVFPIIELDKNDTGLMIISNDKELLDIYDKKTSFRRSVFTLQLNKPISEKEIAKLDKLNEIHYLSDLKDNISVEFKFNQMYHLDKMFSEFDIKIIKKDCVIFDFLNKKNLPRGKWRFLSPKEIIKMKHLKY